MGKYDSISIFVFSEANCSIVFLALCLSFSASNHNKKLSPPRSKPPFPDKKSGRHKPFFSTNRFQFFADTARLSFQKIPLSRFGFAILTRTHKKEVLYKWRQSNRLPFLNRECLRCKKESPCNDGRSL